MLLNSPPKSYENFKDALLLGRESKIIYEEVHSALKLKDPQRSTPKQADPAVESLYLKNNEKKGAKKKFQKKHEKEKEGGKETKSCHYCKKTRPFEESLFCLEKKARARKGKWCRDNRFGSGSRGSRSLEHTCWSYHCGVIDYGPTTFALISLGFRIWEALRGQ